MLILLLLCAGLCLCWIPHGTPAARERISIARWPEYFRRSKDEAQQNLARDAQCLRELAALLRSGMLFDQAAQALLEVRSEASPILTALRGIQAHAKLEQHHHGALGGQQTSSVRRLLWCLKLSSHSGAPLAQVLDQLAQDLEADLEAMQSFDAAMAGPRATTKLLTWLPMIGLGAGFIFGIDLLHTLTTSPAAQLSVAGGVVLWSVNRLWCRRLLSSATAQALT
ncbi:type II secretion system F family protein [Glutamicibacter sp.]|uniref:type II secretion system F family protein n=1 Tax=Glutamicibacter sp. TaxID=1931995 RepID=UPI0028BEB11A|nr:type II secretion system F family protein [Glutamicibacter sp.]